METRASWVELIPDVSLRIAELFNQGQEEYIPGIFEILNKKAGTGAQRNVVGKTGIGELALFNDGDDMPGGRRYKTYITKVAYNDYGKFLDVTADTIDDRDFEGDLDEMRDLSMGANYSQDKAGLQIFNGGFATTVNVNGYKMSWYGDGKPLFSTIHPTTVPGASTKSNASSTSIAFTHTNLETAYVNLIEQKTDDGLAITFAGKPMLVVPPQLRKEASEVTQSTLKPDTANNAINVFNGGMGVDMAMSTHLGAANSGSDTAWYLVVPGRHKLNHEVRQEPQLAQDVNIKNRLVTFTVFGRWADSVTDWRRTWGSKGDGTAYSN